MPGCPVNTAVVPEGQNANSPPIYRWDQKRPHHISPGGTTASETGVMTANVPPGLIHVRVHIPTDKSVGYWHSVPAGTKKPTPERGQGVGCS